VHWVAPTKPHKRLLPTCTICVTTMASTTMMQQRALTGGTTARSTANRALLPCRAAPTNRLSRGASRGLQQVVRAQTQSEKGEPHAGQQAAATHCTPATGPTTSSH
jgi:hypothetical protein